MVAIAPHYLYVIGGQTTASPQVNVVDTAHLADVQVFDLTALRYPHPHLSETERQFFKNLRSLSHNAILFNLFPHVLNPDPSVPLALSAGCRWCSPTACFYRALFTRPPSSATTRCLCMAVTITRVTRVRSGLGGEAIIGTTQYMFDVNWKIIFSEPLIFTPHYFGRAVGELTVLNCGVATIGKIPPPASVVVAAAPAAATPSLPPASVVSSQPAAGRLASDVDSSPAPVAASSEHALASPTRRQLQQQQQQQHMQQQQELQIQQQPQQQRPQPAPMSHEAANHPGGRTPAASVVTTAAADRPLRPASAAAARPSSAISALPPTLAADSAHVAASAAESAPRGRAAATAALPEAVGGAAAGLPQIKGLAGSAAPDVLGYFKRLYGLQF